MKKPTICSNCGNVSWGKTAVKGSTGVELVLWLFFIIPGLIYSIWRSSSRHKVCSVCGNASLIPLDSPNGRRLLEQQGKTAADVGEEIGHKAPMQDSTKMTLFVVGVLVVIIVFAVSLQ